MSKQNAIRGQLKRALQAAFFASILISLPVQAQKQQLAKLPEIELGYPEQAPRVFTNSQGEIDGYYARLAKVLFEKAGMSWHGAGYPAKRLMNNLESGETNFSILVKNPVLDKCCI